MDFSADTRTLLHNLWPALGDTVSALPVIGAISEAAPAVAAARTSRRRLVRRFAAAVPPPDIATQGELLAAATDEEDIEFSWVRQTARRVGTVVLEALEGFGRRTIAGAHGAAGLRARLESRLQALGVEGEAARAAASARCRPCAPHSKTHAAAGCSIQRIARRIRSWP